MCVCGRTKNGEMFSLHLVHLVLLGSFMGFCAHVSDFYPNSRLSLCKVTAAFLICIIAGI